jgi:hypothetical protein
LGEVTVTVTITGSIDDILPILHQLQQMGVGTGGATGEDPLKLRVHSVMTQDEAEGAPPATIMPLQPRFLSFEATPATVKPGETLLVTVGVDDPERRINTVAASLGDLTIDLFDNGSNGDVTAGDGIWSNTITVPVGLGVGGHPLAIKAFNADGGPVIVKSPGGEDTPLTMETAVSVQE